MKILLTVCLSVILIYAVCPNNCGGHGKCEANGVCSCYKKSDGSEYDYVGNDCGCAAGDSLAAPTFSSKYSARKNDDSGIVYSRDLEEVRSLSSIRSDLVKLSSVNPTSTVGIYEVSITGEFKRNGVAVDFVNEIGGIIDCFSSDHSFVIQSEIVGYCNDKYYMKGDAKFVAGLECSLIMTYTDFSMFNPTKPKKTINDKEWIVEWINIGFTTAVTGLVGKNNLKMVCVVKEGDDLTTGKESSTLTIASENNNIKFTLTLGDTTDISSQYCHLLVSKDGKLLNTEIQYNKVYTTSPLTPADSNMYGISNTDYNKIYTVPSADINNPYTASSFGVLNCNIPGKYDIQTSYLLGDDSSPASYYILYDFAVVGINGARTAGAIPILYNCELTQYKDFSMYFPVEVDGECSGVGNCPITWKGMCNAFKSYLPDSTAETVQFACRNDSNEVELYDYTIPKECSGDVSFTPVDANNLPKGRICYLIAGNINKKAVSIDISESELYDKYLTKKSSTTQWKYYSSLPTSTPTFTTAGIYKVNGLNLISTSTGGIMKCVKYENGIISDMNSDINLLYKNGNDYYIYTTNTITDVTGSDCGLLYPHKDMTLYPNTVVDKTVKFEKMSYYFQLLGFYKSIQEKYTMLCGAIPTEAGVIFTEYSFTLTPPTLPYYESTSADVVFTTESTISDVKYCFLLSSFDGKKITVDKSDLTNKYVIKNENGWKLSLKTITTPTAITGSNDIYKVTGVKYEGIELKSAGGLLECRNKVNNKPLGFAKIYSYYEDSKDNSPTYGIKYYFVETGKTPTPEYYDCSVKEIYNDLTLYLPPQKYVDNNVVTWTNMKDIFPNIYEGYKKEGIAVSMLCENGKADEYGIYSATAKDSSTGNNVEFTIASSTKPENGKKCFLMADSKGKAITALADIQKSDLGKIYDVTQSDDVFTLKLKSTIPKGKEQPVDSGIYELSNVKYDIGTELSCLTYDTNEVWTGLILNKEGDKYLMSSTTKKDLSVLKCMIINKYNDLSNYVTCTASASKDCIPTITKNILQYIGITNKKYTFQCGENTKISKSYESTSNDIKDEVDKVKFTFSDSITGTCYLLSYFNGNSLSIESSDVRSSHFIGVSSYVYHNQTKPNEDPVEIPDEDISIIGEIGLIGANIQCKNGENGEYMGTAVYLGKDVDGNNIINSENLKEGNKYVCEVNEVINDFSLIKSEIVDGDSCSREYCVIVIKKLKSLFKFFKRRLSEDEEVNKIYNASCIKGDVVKIYNFELEKEFSDPFSPDAMFKLSESDTNEELPIGMECSLLATADGNPVELEETQISTKLYERDGKFYTSSCDIKDDGKDNLYCENKDDSTITLSEDGKKCLNKIMENSNVLLIPSKEVNTTLLEKYLKVGRWINVGGNEVQILKIEKEKKTFECITGKEDNSVRLLFESRNLSPISGYKVTISQKIDVLNLKSSSIQLILSTTKYSPLVKVECSNNGKCNRESGICECFDGFTGYACQRIDCPNNCNGNGRCVPLSELLSNEDLKYYNTEYDNDKVYGCLCDKRHRGYDCSLIECPSGEDPEEATNAKDSDGEYRDCSGRGICNYNTGVCECFDGFSGEGCQTMAQMM